MFVHNKKNNYFIWIIVLSLALLSAQGMRLHIHYHDCEHPDPDPTAARSIVDQANHAKIHLVTQDAHNAHSMTGVSELDISPQGLLKQLSHWNVQLPVVIVVLLMIPAVFFALSSRRRSSTPSPPCWRYAIAPPLRSPPQDSLIRT
jgi:hypothetical protein